MESSTARSSNERLLPPEPQVTIRLGLLGTHPKRYCKSCGADKGGVSSSSSSPASGKSSALRSSSSAANPLAPPVRQYAGMERRADLCHDCELAPGLLAHVEFYKLCLRSPWSKNKVSCKATLEKVHQVLCTTVGVESEHLLHVKLPRTGANPDFCLIALGRSPKYAQ